MREGFINNFNTYPTIVIMSLLILVHILTIGSHKFKKLVIVWTLKNAPFPFPKIYSIIQHYTYIKMIFLQYSQNHLLKLGFFFLPHDFVSS